MKLTSDESRALTFLAGLLILSAAVRLVGMPAPGDAPAGEFDLAAHVNATRDAVSTAERASTPLAPGERIDPNRAPAVELDRLPRIGPALAERIIADRDENGPFRSPDDLARVAGVGDAMVSAIREHLDLASPPGGRRGVGARTGRVSGAGSTGGGRSLAGSGGPPDGRAVRAGALPGGATGGGVIDLNRADAAALTVLTGIGPVLADRIIAHRDSAGPFPDVDALGAVKGIGPATLERLRPRLAVGRP